MNLSSPFHRRKLLLFLFGLAVFLILINLVLKNTLFSQNNNGSEINSEEAGQRFKNIIFSFGIEEKLITETKVKDKLSGLLVPSFKVQVPKDLSIPEILQDVFNNFGEDSLLIESVEKNKGGKSTLVIRNKNSAVLFSEFDYSKNVSRVKEYFAIIINDIEFDELKDSILIESVSSLNFLIRPKSNYLHSVDYIKNNRKEYSLLIDDEIEEQKYMLGTGYSVQRILSVLKTLVIDFSNATFFVIDDNSKFYNSTNHKILSDELAKRKIKLFRLSDFIFLNEDEDLLTDFSRRMENPGNNGLNVFLFEKENYEKINPEMKKFYKKGYRIINSSLIIDNFDSSPISE